MLHGVLESTMNSFLLGPYGARWFHIGWMVVRQSATPRHDKHPSFLLSPQDSDAPMSAGSSIENSTSSSLSQLLNSSPFYNKQKIGMLASRHYAGLPLSLGRIYFSVCRQIPSHPQGLTAMCVLSSTQANT